MSEEACCTCASILTSTPPSYSFETEKLAPDDPPRRLPCCNRLVCAGCIAKNPRFASYCPFCQVSTGPSSLPQGLRDPPVYTSPPPSPPATSYNKHAHLEAEPPAYSAVPNSTKADLSQDPAPDVTHHLHPSDTLASLSLAYAVPIQVLRQHNNLWSDHLLSARRTLSIPGSHYKCGVSLSPDPVESEEEVERKSKVRRFMVGVKCHAYDVAELYLKQADYDVKQAVEAYKADEKWEKENPYKDRGKTKVVPGTRKGGGGVGLAGQLH